MLMLFAEYVKIVDEDILAYTDEGRQFAQHGDMQKAQLMLTKKKLAEKEVCQRQIKIMSCLPETHTIIIYITFSWKSPQNWHGVKILSFIPSVYSSQTV